ncbi:MAG TPA: glycosyltransferase family 9 protein [Bordetella sp.]
MASQSPVRIGYAANFTAPCHAWLQKRLFTHLLPDNFGKTHMSLRMAEISKQLRKIRSIDRHAPAHDARGKVSGLRNFSWQASASNVMVVAPSASTPTRIWPIERYAEVINHLYRSRGIKPVIIGGPADKAVCRQLLGLIQNTEAVDMAGQLSLVESLALIGTSRLLLTNESGPMHMGRISNAPTVVLASGADFTNYLQYPDPHSNYRVVTADDKSCFDCSWHCIYKSPPGQVIKPCLNAVGGGQALAAIESLLETTATSA